MLNGLDLFSGIGGLSIALREWVRPMAYCEIDSYCQGILLNRMFDGRIHKSPIWGDICTFDPLGLWRYVDIIYGGFPCQDISVAGHGKGLEGERSGLFFEIVRLAKEIEPKFIFLENVPAITSRGGLRVVREIAEMGYDCRWCVISAASIGALHRRERWFLLAHAKHTGSHGSKERGSIENPIYVDTQGKNTAQQFKGSNQSRVLATESLPNSSSLRCDEGSSKGIYTERQTEQHEEPSHTDCEIPNIGRVITDSNSPRFSERESTRQIEGVQANIASNSQILNYWENTEPPVCGVAHGIPHRVDRIRALGNSVVPSQAKEAFKILMGLT